MLEQNDVLSKVKELAKKNHDIEVLWLYGSRAGEQYQSHSDFDFAIAFKNFSLSETDKYLRPNELALEWAAHLNMNSNDISIVDINRVPAYLAFNVIDLGKILFQQETSRVYKEQSRIFSQFEYQNIENSK